MTDNAPGWLPDPTGRFEHRYWDGSQWTDNVANAGIASTDPFAAPAGDGAPGWADPTAVGGPAGAPTPADTTSVWPVPPPAPDAPASPGAGPLAAATSGSRRAFLIGGIALAVVAAAVAAALLLGGDDGGDDRDRIRTELAAQLNDGGALSGDQATCLADAIIDDVGTDKLKDVDFSADEPPAAIADELTTAALAALERCDVDAKDFLGGDGSDGSASTGDGGTTGGSIGSGPSLPADFQDQLADVYENDMGLPRAKARCLAGKIGEAIRSGDLSQDQAMRDVFGYFRECDIDMSELNGN